MSKQFKPTESELEILSILWDKGNASVREVHEVVQLTKEFQLPLIKNIICL